MTRDTAASVSSGGDLDRRGLRRALRERYPWLQAPQVGPRSVDAGECDRCGRAPRVVPTCGPCAWEALCRDCVAEIGLDAWCGGHAGDGERMLAWAAALPDEWEVVTRLWWVATGEVRLAQLMCSRPDALPAAMALLRRG